MRGHGAEKPKYPHWSKASLCFDLHNFRDEYKREHQRLLAVDFTKVLSWVITDPQDGESTYPQTSELRISVVENERPSKWRAIDSLKSLMGCSGPESRIAIKATRAS